MNARVNLARFLARLGRVIESLSIMVMRPEDMAEYSRQTYSQEANLTYITQDEMVDEGLFPQENALLDKTHIKQGRALILGLGGGREAIALARRGFEVVGIDIVPEMVERARENATRRGVLIDAKVQGFHEFEATPESFHLVMIMSGMYSAIPTKERRVKFLKRVKAALKPGGCFVCNFLFNPAFKTYPAVEAVRKAVAWMTRGYQGYEKGDQLWRGAEFGHAFLSEQEVRREFSQAGFEILYLDLKVFDGEAVLKKGDSQV